MQEQAMEQESAEDQEEQRGERQAMMARAETCWATTSPTSTEKGRGSKGKVGKQVNAFNEQEKAGEDTGKDIGVLPNAL